MKDLITMGKGKFTGELGYELYEKYDDTKYDVYYAHLKEGITKHEQPNFQKRGLVPFFGEYSNATSLGFVDIVCLNTETNNVEIGVEIEERKSPPKKIIGDIMSVMLSEQIRIDGDDYSYGNLVFIMGTKVNPKGSGSKKTKLLCEKLSNLNDVLGKRKMEIIPVVAGDREELIEKVRTLIEYLLD